MGCHHALVLLSLQHEAAAAGAASAVAGPGLQTTGPSLRASSLQGHLGVDGAAAAGPAAGLTPLAAPAAAGSRSAGTPASVDGDPGGLSLPGSDVLPPQLCSILFVICIVLHALYSSAFGIVLTPSARVSHRGCRHPEEHAWHAAQRLAAGQGPCRRTEPRRQCQGQGYCAARRECGQGQGGGGGA